ncbi:MAG TPA: fimbrillin family protein [Bacteroides reticulotermitis]|nr:fimbrillin family protein [Bacteroides reticulotermitis]
MKVYNYISILLLAGAAAFTSCSQDEEVSEGDRLFLQNFQINVFDGGFQYMDVNSTRATESGYSTKFAEEDAIGIFAVKGEAIVGEINNRKFTMQDGIWTLDDDGDVIEYKGSEYQKMKFYAYYPFNKSVTFDPTKSDPFEAYVKSWKIGGDQSEGEYTKYDLMTSIGTVEGDRLKGKISFNMKHQMALAVIQMPELVYTFTNSNINDYKLPVTPGLFMLNTTEAVPYYQESTGTYRFLVNPQSSFTIKGTYTGAKEMEYTASGTLQSGTAKKYKISDSNTINHTLQLGDYYCADGKIVSKDAEIIPENCIGIVCYAGNPQPSITAASTYTETQDALRRDYPNCNHGVVLSLNNAVYNDASSGQFHENKDIAATYGDWFSSDENWTGKFDNCNTANGSTVPETRYPAFMGYNNTTLLTMCYEGKGSQTVCNYAYNFITAYRNTVTVPAATSPWYLPSVVCWNQVAANLNAINGSLNKVTNAEQMTSTTSGALTGHYWTSTQRNGTFQWTHAMDGGNYSIICERGSRAGYFRMMLAF